MSKAQYINEEKFNENVKTILQYHNREFKTAQDLINFVLAEFTPEQIDESLVDMPFCDDKQRFWYANRKSFKIVLDNVYRQAYKEANTSPRSYEEERYYIDQAFDEVVGVFNYFVEYLHRNAEIIKQMEENGLWMHTEEW